MQSLASDLDIWDFVVEQVRGIVPDQVDKNRRILTRSEFIALNKQEQEEFEAGQTPEEKAEEDELTRVNTQVLQTLGLVDPSIDLNEELTDFFNQGIGGFYDGDERQLNVIVDDEDASFSPSNFKTYVHEYVHFLQDVRFDTFDDSNEIEDDEAAAARTALIEGEAEFISQIALIWGIGVDYLEAALNPVSETPTEIDPDATPQQDFTYFIARTFLFSYREGIDFVDQLAINVSPYPSPSTIQQQVENFEAWAALLDELHANPPVTTEQVFHLEKYMAMEPAIPVEFGLADELQTAGWAEVTRSTWGELGLRTWFEALVIEGDGTSPASNDGFARIRAAAEGWGGDQILLMTSGCDDVAMTTLIEWDSPASDAQEFTSTLDEILRSDSRFTLAEETIANAIVFQAPVGYVAIWDMPDSQSSIVVTADSVEVAENLIHWTAGERDLLDPCVL